MSRLCPIALVLALPTAALAQASPPFTTPAGYLTKDGDRIGGGSGYAYYFGQYANARVQMIDGELKGKGVKIVNAVGYRLEYLRHGSSTAGARSWTNVTLSVAECSFDAATATFAVNALTTPTVVYNAAASWPGQIGLPPSNPAPWDQKLRFPFSRTYVYADKNDLLLDYTFSGGTMANSAPWGTNASGSSPSYLYFLDARGWFTALSFGRSVYRTNNNTCNDSAWTHSNYASAAVQVGLYSKLSTMYADSAQLQVFGNATAPSALILKAFSLRGLTPIGVGINIGAACNNLMIDINGAVVLPFVTDANGNHNPWTYIRLGNLASVQNLGNLEIWCQGAWADSVTGNFSLTSCERCRPTWNFPVVNDVKLLPRKKTLFNYNKASATGLGPFDHFFMNPITRYN